MAGETVSPLMRQRSGQMPQPARVSSACGESPAREVASRMGRRLPFMLLFGLAFGAGAAATSSGRAAEAPTSGIGAPVVTDMGAPSMETPGGMAVAKPPVTTIWCSTPDGERQRLYISEPKPLVNPTHMALDGFSSRFARTVNARFGLHLVVVGQYCNQYHSTSASSAARSALIARMTQNNFTAISIGIF